MDVTVNRITKKQFYNNVKNKKIPRTHGKYPKDSHRNHQECIKVRIIVNFCLK